MSPIRVSQEFDQRLADWFEADADLAPPTVLATVMAAYPSIPQRRASRVPRRFHTMTRLALMGAAAAVLIAAGIGGLLFAAGQTGPRPDTQPSSSPAPSVAEVSAAPAVALPRTFTSNQNGYTIEYPADWLPTPATTAWLPGTETRWGDPALDVLQSPAARVVAASQPLADGQTPDQWYQAYCRLGAPKPDCAAYATTWKQVGVGPSKGYLDIDGQPALPGSIKVGAPMYDAVIVVNGRGYEFTLDGDAPRAVFDQLLATVRFIPATGVSTQPLTDTFTSIIYGYSIKHGASWEITPATLPSDDPASNDNGSDRIQPTGTDTTVQIWVDSLGSQTFEAWKQQLGHDIANDVAIPESCRPSDPTAWPSIPVGDKTGFRIIKCNQQQVIVDAGDRVYSFLWGHDTFTTSEHLPLPIFDQMLTSVTFPKQPPHLPGPGMPASSPAVSPRS